MQLTRQLLVFSRDDKCAQLIDLDSGGRVEVACHHDRADDGVAEVVKEFKNGKLTLGVDAIGRSVAAALTGSTVDDNGVLISTSEDGGSPVAIGFRAKKSNGHYRYFWLYRVKFGVPSTNLATKGDSITFSTPTIEGTVLRRNKTATGNLHPWKAEADEDDSDIESTAISSWYTAVYEPTFVSGV